MNLVIAYTCYVRPLLGGFFYFYHLVILCHVYPIRHSCNSYMKLIIEMFNLLTFTSGDVGASQPLSSGHVCEEDSDDDEDLSRWPKESTVMLIEKFKARPILYAYTTKEYHHKTRKEAAFEQLADELNITGECILLVCENY